MKFLIQNITTLLIAIGLKSRTAEKSSSLSKRKPSRRRFYRIYIAPLNASYGNDSNPSKANTCLLLFVFYIIIGFMVYYLLK